MKFILTGCTGFIGSEVLSQCLRNPSITSIIALSRRELPKAVANDPKLKVLIMKDFNNYPDSVIKELSGADACIWCMGTTAGIRELEVDYLFAFGNAFAKTIPETKKRFRYLHLSGSATERDPEKALWMKSEMRKMKGEAKLNMFSFTKKEETQGLWETLIVKSGFVIQKEVKSPRDFLGWMAGNKFTLRVDELAAFMIDASANGWGNSEDTMSDVFTISSKGRKALGK
ncbi:hypothetical protein G7Y89_g4214 [Cudoniella acicularis]|uniref:NAD(P)-binding domain-containing protein n=1 Tax=Cudoniella acicularis TaxID=354080 RepID=A0A8H4W7N8_9HELO|nr:hypothetical protein G7Y89_g4214 [Cudoniella acicularis]